MAGEGQPEPEAKEFVCQVCGEAWPTARALSGHLKAHSRKGKAPLLPFFTEYPALGPGTSVMPILSSFFMAPPVMAMGPPAVAPPGLFLGGLLPPPAFAPTPVAGVGTSAGVVRPQALVPPPPVAPPGLFLGGLLPPPSPAPTPVAGVGTSAGVVRSQALVPLPPPPADHPVVSAEGEIIRMALLEANPAFWEPYRMAMDPPVEYDFMGLGLQRRPGSPSPSLSSWLDA